MATQPTALWHGIGFESRLPAAQYLNKLEEKNIS